ncbi:MAG: replicative DNA helicase [Thermoanaerobaculia bacterium]
MTPDRPLPHSLEAERTLLGAILYGASLDSVAFVEPSDFFDARHVVGWRRMVAMKRGGIDLVTFRAALEDAGELEQAGGVVYVASLVDGVPDLANVQRYAAIVREKGAARRLFRDAERIQVEILRSGGLNAGLLAEVRDSLSDSMAPVSRAKAAPALVHEFAERFDRRCNGDELAGVGTGLPTVDATTGGIQRAVLSIGAARTRVGKTAFALQVTKNALQSGAAERVAVYSLEMSDAMLAERLIANISDVSLWLVKNPRMATRAQRDAIAAASLKLGSLGKRLIVNDSLLDLNRIEAEVRREAAGGLDLIVIDYLQLVRGGKGEQRYVQVGDVSARLIALAKDTGAAVLALAQLGREAESRKPCLTDLRESGNLEQDARTIFLLDRPRHRGESVPECQAWIQIAKHSEGESGAEIELHFNGALQRFEEVADADTGLCRSCRGGGGDE